MIEYTCPKCGGHEFELQVLQTARVRFQDPEEHGGDEHEVVDLEVGDVEWDDETRAACTSCSFAGQLSEMETP